jgi:hypothetical protein
LQQFARQTQLALALRGAWEPGLRAERYKQFARSSSQKALIIPGCPLKANFYQTYPNS